MFTLETRLAIYAGILIAISGWALYERHHLIGEGETKCHNEDQTAKLAKAAADHQVDQDTIHALQAQLEANASPTQPSGRAAPTLRVCVPTVRYVSNGPTAAGAQPGTGTVQGTDRGVSAGMAATVDAGPSMQDFALTGLFYLSDSGELYDRSLKQSNAHR